MTVTMHLDMDKFDATELPLPEQDGDPGRTHISMRALVAPKEAGIIIGRGGTHIAALREKTGVKAGVSKVVPRMHRVLTLTGPLDCVARAFYLIALSFLENETEDETPEAPIGPADARGEGEGEGAASPAVAPALPPAEEEGERTTVVRILLSHTLMGAVIGKQGTAIKAVQEASETRMVASKEMLPNSTERVVDITGTPAGIQRAVHAVGRNVALHPVRPGTVLYEPDPSERPAPLGIGVPFSAFSPSLHLPRLLPERMKSEYGLTSVPVLSLDVLPSPRYPPPLSLGHAGVFPRTGMTAGSTTSSAAIATAAAQGAAVAPAGSFVAGGITGVEPATAPFVVDAANLRTQNISIPADMVGCIIGKGGSKITQIRRLSGSRISIARVSHDASGERLFTIQGTPASNEKALYLLYNQLETEKERRQLTPSPQEGEPDT